MGFLIIGLILAVVVVWWILRLIYKHFIVANSDKYDRCPQCGEYYRKGTTYCPNCGEYVSKKSYRR